MLVAFPRLAIPGEWLREIGTCRSPKCCPLLRSRGSASGKSRGSIEKSVPDEQVRFQVTLPKCWRSMRDASL
jgi:hypothetical protein